VFNHESLVSGQKVLIPTGLSNVGTQPFEGVLKVNSSPVLTERHGFDKFNSEKFRFAFAWAFPHSFVLASGSIPLLPSLLLLPQTNHVDPHICGELDLG
jgi:hypothetical protein